MSVESTKVEGGQGLGLNGQRHNAFLDGRRDPLSQPAMMTCHHVSPCVKYVYQSSRLKFGQLQKWALREAMVQRSLSSPSCSMSCRSRTVQVRPLGPRGSGPTSWISRKKQPSARANSVAVTFGGRPAILNSNPELYLYNCLT